MSVAELNGIIEQLKKPEFNHVSKTYWMGEFVNIACGRRRFTINLKSDYDWSVQIIQSLRK